MQAPAQAAAQPYPTSPEPFSVSQHIQQARLLIEGGEHTKALAEQTRAIALEPSRAMPYRERGRTWLMKRQYELAIADYTRALELAPRDAESYLGRAQCFHASGNIERAVEDYTTALTINPRLAEALKMRGHARLAEGRYDLGLADFKRASNLDPRETYYLTALGVARYFMGDLTVSANNLVRSLSFKDDMRGMLFLYLVRAKSGAEAGKELEKNAGYLRQRTWPYPVIEVYLGRRSPDAVLALATDEAKQCEANFYIGEWLALQGQRSDGVASLKHAARTCPKLLVEYEAATAELRRIGY